MPSNNLVSLVLYLAVFRVCPNANISASLGSFSDSDTHSLSSPQGGVITDGPLKALNSFRTEDSLEFEVHGPVARSILSEGEAYVIFRLRVFSSLMNRIKLINVGTLLTVTPTPHFSTWSMTPKLTGSDPAVSYYSCPFSLLVLASGVLRQSGPSPFRNYLLADIFQSLLLAPSSLSRSRPPPGC